MSGSELAVLMAILGLGQTGAQNDYIERNLHVLVVSASASSLNQLRIERDFANASFFYGMEDAPVDPNNGSSKGLLSLLNREDSDPVIAAPFSVRGGTHTVTLSAETFLSNLLELQDSIGEQLYFADAHGVPLTEIKLENLNSESVKERKLFLLPKKQKSTAMMPTTPGQASAAPATPPQAAEWEYLSAARSVMVYIASAADMKARLAKWAPAMKSAKNSKPVDGAWDIGAEAYRDQYQTMGLSVSVSERLRKKESALVAIGDFALVSHKLQSDGRLTIPQVDETEDQQPKDTDVILPIVTKLPDKTRPTGFSADAGEFLKGLVRGSLKDLVSDEPLTCYINEQAGSDKICTKDDTQPSKQKIAMALVGDQPERKATFFISHKPAGGEAERRWKVEMTLKIAPPRIGDRTLFPITTAQKAK